MMTPEEIKKIEDERREENAALKGIIESAKAKGVHKSVIRMLETYDQFKDDDKSPMILYEGATEEQLVEFEQDFEIKIPAAYRAFLKFTNGALINEAGVDFYGVDKNAKLSLYSENDEEFRRSYDMSEKFPGHYLIIGANNEGCPICADVTNGEIIFWDIEMDQSSCNGDDFNDYLVEDVIGYLEWKKEQNEQKTSE